MCTLHQWQWPCGRQWVFPSHIARSWIGIAITGSRITAEFSNPVIPSLACNPGIYGIENRPLIAYKSVIKWHFVTFVVLQMTNDNHYAAVYIFYNFAIYKCDQESVYVTICLLFLVNVLHKLVYSVNLTSQLYLYGVPGEMIIWGDQFLTETVDHTNLGLSCKPTKHAILQWRGICHQNLSHPTRSVLVYLVSKYVDCWLQV